jgi:hypothetical protein
MRVIDHPMYLLWGSGQGRDHRFGEFKGFFYEIHSSLLAVAFYYGLGGLFIFLGFIWRSFLFKKNLMFLIPIFVYGLFTYGLRSPYFWVALAFISVMPQFSSIQKSFFGGRSEV